LVEMEEAAQICRQATPQSLVVLDEVGRGTSTFDGMVIAQAIIEYLAKRVKAKTLFATHYHELTQLQDRISSIANYHMESKRTDEGIIFLHRLIQGAAGGSFGLEVAKLAGLPDEVVTRAAAILKELAASKHVFLPAQTQHDAQRSIFESQLSGAEERVKILERVVSELDSVDLDSLSPRAAFDLIWRMSEKRRGM
ncbi:DNA mismatch repair protein MutS, partial [bacterium]|nr:DNA mismatch repair protein MutS [bacterium]